MNPLDPDSLREIDSEGFNTDLRQSLAHLDAGHPDLAARSLLAHVARLEEWVAEIGRILVSVATHELSQEQAESRDRLPNCDTTDPGRPRPTPLPPVTR
jgi:hypothetical protein